MVSGLGLLGQLCAQMAKMSGAAKVYGIDTYAHRRKAAEENGCDETFDPASGKDIALEIRKEPATAARMWCLRFPAIPML